MPHCRPRVIKPGFPLRWMDVYSSAPSGRYFSLFQSRKRKNTASVREEKWIWLLLFSRLRLSYSLTTLHMCCLWLSMGNSCFSTIITVMNNTKHIHGVWTITMQSHGCVCRSWLTCVFSARCRHSPRSGHSNHRDSRLPRSWTTASRDEWQREQLFFCREAGETERRDGNSVKADTTQVTSLADGPTS